MIKNKNSCDLKILVGYHKPATLLKDDVFVPIHLGRKLFLDVSKDGYMNSSDYQWMLDNMIGDDTGDNISHLNRKYCEVTALYWAWKNYDKLGNPDRIGFMHYRRHFIFNKLPINIKRHMNAWPEFAKITPEYMQQTGLADIKNHIDKNILPEYVDATKISSRTISNLRSFLNYAHTPDFFAEMVRIVMDKYPKYAKYAENIDSEIYMLPCNMFILPKHVFFDYCKFMFDVLFTLDKRFEKFNGNTPEHNRQIAWTSEYVSTIYFNKQMSEHGPDYVQRPISFVLNTDIDK